MTKKINYTFAAVPKQLIKDKDLSALEFRILCVILSAADENLNCTLSYSSIADDAGINRRNTIINIQNLIEKGYLTKKGRNGFRHNNSIANILHFEADKAGTSTASNSVARDTSLVSQETLPSVAGDTNLVSQETLPSVASDTQSRSSCKSLNNIYLKTKEKEEKETATADGAAVLSMPDGGQAAESSAKNECVEALAAKERQALDVIDTYAFKGEIDFIKYAAAGYEKGEMTVKTVYVLRKKSKFSNLYDFELQQLAAEITNNTGLMVGWTPDYKKHFLGETTVEG